VTEPLVKSVLLVCSPARAFELFTEHASAWWPVERRHTKDPGSAIAMLASGRFWERAADGREVELGRVRVWEPPARLVLDWYPGTDAEHPTSVTIRFTPEGDGTRVTVEHVPTAASADLWGPRVARYAASWDAVLPALAAVAHG
jgi:uncharacterized protein YndB with AHSA1/START domain